MDDRRPQSSCYVTNALNFGIDRILENDTKSGKYKRFLPILYAIVDRRLGKSRHRKKTTRKM